MNERSAGMKHRGFTLVELLIILSIITLLLVVATPTLTVVLKVARATICRGNLSRIGTVFSLTKQASGELVTTAKRTMVYPEWRNWPREAQAVCNEKDLYRCPEDDREHVDMEALQRGVEYRSTFGGGITIPLVGNVENNYVLSRRGSDFTEYVFEEAGNINQNFWVPGSHNDGWIRLHDTGLIEIVSCNCGGDNQLWIDGKPAFGPDPSNRQHTQMRPNVGAKVRTKLADAGLSSYGVNSYAHRYSYGSTVLVLLDYEARTANPDDTAKTRELLLKSRRHIDRLNVLLSDGSVSTMGVSELDPILNHRLWNPSLLPPDGDEQE